MVISTMDMRCTPSLSLFKVVLSNTKQSCEQYLYTSALCLVWTHVDLQAKVTDQALLVTTQAKRADESLIVADTFVVLLVLLVLVLLIVASPAPS